MTAGRSLTLAQLRSHVADIRKRVLDARLIGLHVSNGWEGPDRLECDGQTYAVVQADTVLALREALLEAEARPLPTVLLTALDELVLGLDVRARLAKGRLIPVDLWDSVRGLFKAREIDPTVRARGVAQALLEYAPADGYPPVPIGVLDAGTVWRTLIRHALLLRDGEPTLARLLIWAATSVAGVERYRCASEDFRAAMRQRLAGSLGLGAETVIDMIEGGAARDALAVAIVCEVVFAEDGPGELQAAAVRLERFQGNRPISAAVGRLLARAGEEAVRELALEDPPADLPHLTRADEILREVQAAGQAYRGRLTRAGWEQRLERFTAGLSDALTGREPGRPLALNAVADCTALARPVLAHAFAGRYRDQADRVRMALKLLRWLQAPASDAGAFEELACRYRDELAFVDWSRDALAGGDPQAPAAVSVAYRLLTEAAHAERARSNEAFAVTLRQAERPVGVIPVEEVLERVIIPLVRDGHRVLLAVLDGLSWAVAHELLPELRQERWEELTWQESGQPPPSLLATIPSVTELSRASLLGGRFARGDAGAEKQRFAGHEGLAAACERRHPPVVFHKAQLTEGARGALSADVQQTVASEKHRVVGVVINAIDDELSGAEQVRHAWTLEAIRPLGALLRAARDAGRVVVLAADHGHVWHRQGSAYHKAAEAGERWRPADVEPARPGELLAEGARVRDGRDRPRVIVPWDEGLRYGNAKNGYHGGVTPQEMLAPLIVLASASTLPRKGLVPCRLQPPAWWDDPAAPAVLPPDGVAGRPTRTGQPRTLFDFGGAIAPTPELEVPASVPPCPPATPTFQALLRSEIYGAQKQLVQKHLPDDATVLAVLESLDRHGGTLTFAALAQQAGVLPLRLDGLLAKLQRLLNVDGYEVLQVERTQNRVALNVPLLRRQFQLG
jgi:hypothetical protein